MSIVAANQHLSPKVWTKEEAIKLCVAIEAVCPAFGCHVALTGGSLYKTGPRKDADILFYRIRQVPKIDMDGLWGALLKIGVQKLSGCGWLYKAEWFGMPIDFFFPEEQKAYDADGNEITYGEA